MNTTNPIRKRTTPLQRYGLPYSRGLQPPRRTARAGGSIILRGILSANRAVRFILKSRLPFRLLGISSPDGAGRNDGLPAPQIYRAARDTHSHSFPYSPIPSVSQVSRAVRHSPMGIHSDKWVDALPLDYCNGWLFSLVDAIGRSLPYIIGGCIISLLIYNLWKVL